MIYVHVDFQQTTVSTHTHTQNETKRYEQWNGNIYMLHILDIVVRYRSTENSRIELHLVELFRCSC